MERDLLDRRVVIAVVVVVVGLIVGALVDHRSTAAAYLVAWIAISAIPIGTLGALMISYLVRRAWTNELHSVMTALCATIPMFGVLFLPVLLDLAALYPDAVHHETLPAFKAIYLAPWFVTARTVIYFVIWTWLATRMQAASPDPDRMVRAASGGLIVYVLSVSLAGVDWLEALEPHFHSSIYGLLFSASYCWTASPRRSALDCSCNGSSEPADTARCCYRRSCSGRISTRCSTSSFGPAISRRR